MCLPSRSSHGAASMVTTYSVVSDSSLDQGNPSTPGISATFRSSTSAQIVSAIAPSSAHAARANASSTLPQACERRSKLLLGEELLHLRAVLRRQLDDARPARVVGLLRVLPGGRFVEADRLDAGRGLALHLFLRVCLPEVIATLEVQRLLLQELALPRAERLPL